MRIGLKRNMSVKEMFCYFMMPDGSVVGLKDHAPFDAPTLEAKGLRFERIEPGKQWRMSFSGGMERTIARKARKSHVEFDLRFEGLNDMFDYRSCVSEHGERLSNGVASEHFEQIGRVTGSISTGLDDFRIQALGERDHSWGVRDWMAPKGWTWLTCQFSESHAFNLTRLVMDGGSVDAGFVFMDGRNIPVAKADLNVNADFERNIKSFEVILHDSLGGDHRVFGSVIRKVDVHHRSQDGTSMATMSETLSRYTIAGKTGYGIAEFLARTE